MSFEMNNEVKVSICVITYNHENYIDECLNSLISQKTDFIFEIVIRDDKSTDRTYSIIKSYEKKYPNIIRLLDSSINLGMGRNFRSVINAANGDYISICEGDDFFTDDSKIKIQYSKALEHPSLNLFVHSAYLVTGNSRREASSTSQFFFSAVDCQFDTIDVIKFKGQFAATSSYFIKSEVLRNLPILLDDAPVLDLFIESYGSINNSGLFSPDIMSSYRIDANDSWTCRVSKSSECQLVFANKMLEIFNDIHTDFNSEFNVFKSRVDWLNFIVAVVNLKNGNNTIFQQNITPQISGNYVSTYHNVLSKIKTLPLLPKTVYYIYCFVKWVQQIKSNKK